MNILIVDDENAILRGVLKIITDNTGEKHTIELASDAMQALQKLDGFHADLIITDIYMSMMNGLELIELAQNRHLCNKFIILTGHEDFKFAQKAIKYKVEDYIVKPINKKELLDTISRVSETLELEHTKQNDIPGVEIENLQQKLELASCTTKKIINYVNKYYNNGIYLKKVSSDLDINEKYLCSLVMKELSITFLQYLDYVRVKKAAYLLLSTNKSVSEISLLVGFSNERQMFNVFKKRTLMTPGQYKEKYQKVF